jgi:hypothetical protein
VNHSCEKVKLISEWNRCAERCSSLSSASFEGRSTIYVSKGEESAPCLLKGFFFLERDN